MDYSKIILACYDKLTATYIEIGRLNQIIKINENSSRMIKTHGYSAVRTLLNKTANKKYEMSNAIKSIYQTWTNHQEINVNIYNNDLIFSEKCNIIKPIISLTGDKTAKKYIDVNTNGSLITILNIIKNYSDPLIKSAMFYATTMNELPLESISPVFAEIHLSYILSSIIDMPFFPLQASNENELSFALEEFKAGNMEYWINYFLSLVIIQIENNFILLSEIENYINELKSKMKKAGVSHLKINQFSSLLIDNVSVNAKFISEKTGLVQYRAKLALDLMYENQIVAKSDSKRNTEYYLLDYYRKFLNK